MRLWLDDERPAPSRFDVHVKTAPEAIKLLQSGDVVEVSLDHDLGDVDAGTGYDVATWIEEQAFLGTLPLLKWNVHSANPVGSKRMEAALRNADRFWGVAKKATVRVSSIDAGFFHKLFHHVTAAQNLLSTETAANLQKAEAAAEFAQRVSPTDATQTLLSAFDALKFFLRQQGLSTDLTAKKDYNINNLDGAVSLFQDALMSIGAHLSSLRDEYFGLGDRTSGLRDMLTIADKSISLFPELKADYKVAKEYLQQIPQMWDKFQDVKEEFKRYFSQRKYHEGKMKSASQKLKNPAQKKSAEAWGDLPKGWTPESSESYWKSMGGSVSKCIRKLEKADTEIDDPGAFCASLADRHEPGWRSKPRKEKKKKKKKASAKPPKFIRVGGVVYEREDEAPKAVRVNGMLYKRRD